jgi:hypothetical protein
MAFFNGFYAEKGKKASQSFAQSLTKSLAKQRQKSDNLKKTHQYFL